MDTESRTEIIMGWGKKGVGSYYFIGKEFLFEVMKMFWRWIVVIRAQHWECAERP